VYEDGTIVALGDVGETDEINEKVARPQLSQLLGHRQSQYGSGAFYHLREDVFRADSIIDEGTHDIATAYQIFYIDCNPVVLNLIDEDPGERISDSIAEDIRSGIEDIVNQSLRARITPGKFPKDIGISGMFIA